MKKPLKNVAASVRQRLYDRAKQTNRPFEELLQYYAMERFLYRLGQSPQRDKFVLKGALMFVAWKASRARATRDIDFLAKLENSPAKMESIVRQVCGIEVEPDGIVFDEKSISGERIKAHDEYKGVRIRFKGYLEKARISMQLDVGFGDAVTPAPREIDYPAILDLPAPRLKGYSPETVVAEKFEAMLKLGALNTRLKDFYDLWLLSQRFDFGGATLADALSKTCRRRGTALEVEPEALGPAFARDKQVEWAAFLRKAGLRDAPERLSDVVARIRPFVLPIAASILAGDSWKRKWKAPGPWS